MPCSTKEWEAPPFLPVFFRWNLRHGSVEKMTRPYRFFSPWHCFFWGGTAGRLLPPAIEGVGGNFSSPKFSFERSFSFFFFFFFLNSEPGYSLFLRRG